MRRGAARRTGALAGRGGARKRQDAQALVDIDSERADRFRQAAVGDRARHRHLAEAQMGVDEAEGERRVAVGLRLDERDLPVVPVDRDRAVEGQIPGRERREALRQPDGFRQRREQGAARRKSAGESEADPGRRVSHGPDLPLPSAPTMPPPPRGRKRPGAERRSPLRRWMSLPRNDRDRSAVAAESSMPAPARPTATRPFDEGLRREPVADSPARSCACPYPSVSDSPSST